MFADAKCDDMKQMNKIVSVIAALVLAVSAHAQLAWDTEFSQSDYNNALTVISKTENVSWSNPTLGLFGGLKIGKTIVNIFGIGQDPYNDECVIALPLVGIAETLTFSWQGASSGTISVYQSPDHNNWSLLVSKDGNTISTDTDEEVNLATTTRYLKFAATGKTAAAFRKIKVTELKSLSVGTDEWPFGQAMVDDADGVKNVNVTWTNVVAEVSSTDPHFSASLSTIGQKNLINQTTQLSIVYSHREAGKHSGEIVIAGEGREVRIAVSGETKKFDQTLTWLQELGECIATDQLTLNAFTSSGLDVVYESSDTTIAYVANSAVQIVRAGEVTLTATQPGNYKFNAAQQISKTLTIRKADPMIGVHVDDLTYGQALSEAVLTETLGQVEGTLSWVDVDASTVLDAGDYALSVLFTPANEGIYNTRVMPVALHVNKAVQVITWEDQQTELTVGQPVQSTAVLSSNMPITYAFTECLLRIENGLIVPENEGEVTVIAYHPGNNNYLPTTVIMNTFHVQAAPQVATYVEQLTPEQMRDAQKYMHAGQVYVYYNGSLYNTEGKRVQ